MLLTSSSPFSPCICQKLISRLTCPLLLDRWWKEIWLLVIRRRTTRLLSLESETRFSARRIWGARSISVTLVKLRWLQTEQRFLHVEQPYSRDLSQKSVCSVFRIFQTHWGHSGFCLNDNSSCFFLMKLATWPVNLARTAQLHNSPISLIWCCSFISSVCCTSFWEMISKGKPILIKTKLSQFPYARQNYLSTHRGINQTPDQKTTEFQHSNHS